MGNNQAKEEIIIAQAGNSGGTTATASVWNLTDILVITIFILVLMVIIGFCIKKCKSALETKIRREINRSRELV